MTENNTTTSQNPSQDSIDIKALLLRFWSKRRFILIITAGFTVLGLVAALCQKPKYVSTCTFVPQFASPMQAMPFYSVSSLMPSTESLTAILTGETLSPLVYPQILKNTEFNKELMRVPLHFREWDEPVCLYDFYNDPKYKKFDLIKTIKKYTIDVPRKWLSKIEPKEPEVVLPEENNKPLSIYTKPESSVASMISSMIEFKVNKTEFFYTLTVTAKEALVAAELCQATVELMQKYITDFKLSHARQNLEYIQELYDEAKEMYETKQLALAQYSDANRGAMTATTQIRKEQLTADYNLAYSAFSTMSQQLLTAEVKVREDTPAFALVDPASVPLKRANSRVKTLLMWVFLGFFFGLASVFGLDWLKTQGLNWPKRWN